MEQAHRARAQEAAKAVVTVQTGIQPPRDVSRAETSKVTGNPEGETEAVRDVAILDSYR